jgi:spermidine synthase
LRGTTPLTQHPAGHTSQPQAGWIYALFFISGFPALIYQIVWQRALFTIYGVNIESVTIVVSAFMLGLGLGSLAGGMVSRIPRLPVLAAFGTVELGIGSFGFVSLRLFHAVGTFTAGGSLATTGILTFLLVLAPTILMGGTLPFLVAYLVRISRNVGESVGMLYFVNTLGSAAACLLSAMFIMRLLGEQGSVTMAAAINVSAGTAALLAHILLRNRVHPEIPQTPADAAAGSGAAWFPFPLALAIVCVSGFIALSYEIVWYRAYSFVSGAQARSFALLLGAYLEGVAFGSLFARAACRKAATAGNRRTVLGAISALVVVANGLSFLVVPGLAYWAHIENYGVTLPMVAVSAGLLGAVFPLIAHISVAPDRYAGARLSYLYLANIVGSTTGTILVGFVLMDYLSMRGISVGLLVTGLAMGAAIAGGAVRGWRRVLVVTGAASVALCAAAAAGPLFSTVYEHLLFKELYRGQKFRYLIESRSGVISVLPDGTIYGGGMYDGRFNTSLVEDTNFLARAYAIGAFHPSPRHVLMIGLSSGSWAQVIANHPTVEDLTVVEIDPQYLRLIPLYPAVASLLRNPKVHIAIDDGRRWLAHYPQRRFDLIVMNTSFHWRANISNLLSADFLRMIRPHLEPGGAMYYNTTNSGEAQLTGATVYPYALRVSSFLAVSDTPLQFDKAALKETLLAYRIDGTPVLDPSRAADRRKLDEMLAWTDIEYAPAIRQRNRDKRIVTDDNMGTEWSPPKE